MASFLEFSYTFALLWCKFCQIQKYMTNCALLKTIYFYRIALRSEHLRKEQLRFYEVLYTLLLRSYWTRRHCNYGVNSLFNMCSISFGLSNVFVLKTFFAHSFPIEEKIREREKARSATNNRRKKINFLFFFKFRKWNASIHCNTPN